MRKEKCAREGGVSISTNPKKEAGTRLGYLVSLVFLSFILSACPDLSEDLTIHEPVWMSPCGVQYLGGAWTMPSGHLLDGEGPFRLFNEYLAPCCLDGKTFPPGAKILDIAMQDPMCASLLEPCSPEEPCEGETGIIRFIASLVLPDLQDTRVPDVFTEDHPLRIDRIRVGWKTRIGFDGNGFPLPHSCMNSPLLRIQIDLAGFGLLLDEPYDVDGDLFREFRLPRFSLEILLEPSIGEARSRFVFKKAEAKRYMDWSNPIDFCFFNMALANCFMHESDEYRYYTHYCEDSPITGRVGYSNYFDNNDKKHKIRVGRLWYEDDYLHRAWCMGPPECTEWYFLNEFIPRHGEFYCLAGRLEGEEWNDNANIKVNDGLSTEHRMENAWTKVGSAIESHVWYKYDLNDMMNILAEKMIFATGSYCLFGQGWDPDYSLVSIEQDITPQGEVVFVREPDRDQDGVPNVFDNCPEKKNRLQLDCDGDGLGDVCDQTLCIYDLAWKSKMEAMYGVDFGWRVNSEVGVDFVGTGGWSEGVSTTRSAELYWCDCMDLTEEDCRDLNCINDGRNHQNEQGDNTGWYPITWSRGKIPPECASDQSCPPIHLVKYVRCEDGHDPIQQPACNRPSNVNERVWHWRKQFFPPDGLGQEEYGAKRLKLRAVPVDNDPAEGGMPDVHLTFTPVQHIEYRFEWLEIEARPGAILERVNPLDPKFFQPLDYILIDPRKPFPWLDTAEILGWIIRPDPGPPWPFVMYMDRATGIINRLVDVNVETASSPDDFPTSSFAATAYLQGNDALRFVVGGMQSSGQLSSDVWLGHAGSDLKWSKLDTQAASPIKEDVSVGALPFDLNIEPLVLQEDERLGFVSNEGDGFITVFDLDSLVVLDEIHGFVEPAGLLIRPWHKQLWVADKGTNEIKIVDMDDWQVCATLPLGGLEPGLMMPDQNRSRVFVRAHYEEFGRSIWFVLAIDADLLTLTHWVPYDFHDFETRDAMALSPDGLRLYVARDNYESINVYNSGDLTLIETVDVGRSATGIALSFDGSKMMVTNYRQDSVTLLDTETWEEIDHLEGIPWPAGLALGPNGSTACVTSLSPTGQPGGLNILGLNPMRLMATVDVGIRPTTVKYGKEHEVYVVNASSNSLSKVSDIRDSYATPKPRQDAILLAGEDKGQLYLLGGETLDGISSEMWSFDLAGGVWRLLDESTPMGKIKMPAVVMAPGGDSLLVYGGESSTGPVSGLWLWSGEHGVRRLDTPMRGVTPDARSAATLASLDERGKVFLFGGQGRSGLLGDVWLYSFDDSSWQELDIDCNSGPCPGPRHSAVAVPLLDGKRVAVFGGRGPGDLTSVWILNLESLQWRTIQPTTLSGDHSGVLKRIDYLGKRHNVRVGEILDDSPFEREFERGENRSYRWIGQIEIRQAGTYRFELDADGGARLFIDSRRLSLGKGRSDAFGSCGRTKCKTEPVYLTTGWHDMVLDLTVCRRGGGLRLEVAEGPSDLGLISPARLRHRSREGLVRKAYRPAWWWWLETGEDFDTSPIDESWRRQEPEILGVNSNGWHLVEWTGFINIKVAGEYRFVANASYGAQLAVAEQNLLDTLSGKAKAKTSDIVYLNPGWHPIRFAAIKGPKQTRVKLRFDSSCPELGGELVPTARLAARTLQP